MSTFLGVVYVKRPGSLFARHGIGVVKLSLHMHER